MRLSKGLLQKTCLAIAFLLAAFTVPKIWIQSESSQGRVRDALTQVLGMSVKFERLQVGFRKGVRIKNLTGSTPQGSSIQVKELQLRLRWLPMLAGKLVIAEVRLQNPRMVWVDNPPTQTVDAEPPRPSETTPLETTGAQKALNPNPLNPLNPFNQITRRLTRHRQITLESIALENAEWSWISHTGQSVLQTEGVYFHLETNDLGDGSGRLTVAQGALLGTLAFHGLQAPLELSQGRLKVPKLSAKSGGGELTASATAQLSEPDSPFELDAALENVDLARMNGEPSSARMGGIANGRVRLHGESLRSSTWEGTGEVLVKDGVFKGLSLLQLIGQILQVQELANFKIREADAHFTISNRQVRLSPFVIRSEDIRLDAPGTVTFDKRLALDARLTLAEKLLRSKNLQNFLGRFSAPDDTGSRSIDFRITGTPEKPSTDLAQKILPEGVGSILQQVLGNFLKTKPEPKKQDPAPSPPPGEPRPQKP
jgi:hypothetical protein